MTLILSMIFQLIVILASGLFVTTLCHKSLDSSTRIIGLSRSATVLILGCSPWLLTHTPQYVNLFFALISGLLISFLLTLQQFRNEPIRFTVITAAIPILVLIFLLSQPYFLTFYYNSAFLTGASIGLGIVVIFYIARLKLKRFFSIYLSMQIAALIVSAINLNEWTLLLATSIIVIADFLNILFTYREINHFYSTVHHETTYYKDQFEDAVEKEVKKRTFYMELSKEKMVQMNRTDHLTKLLNRKSIIMDIESLILDKNTTKFALFIFDIDYFKKINDTKGHSVGDDCLRSLAGILKSNAREYDLIGRFGGDEFILALPMLGYKESIAFGERLMEQIYMNTSPRFSISMGLSVYPWDGETYKQLFEVADKGLYLAKEDGRNRIGYKGYIKA